MMNKDTDFQIENDVLIRYHGYERNIIIPDGVREIGNFAFYQRSLHTVQIPDTVQSIGENAFAFCQYLQSVVIPDSVLRIASFAFYRCERLQTVTMGANLRSIGACAYKDCLQLKTVHLSERILMIQKEAFFGCSALRHFHFGGKFKIIRNCFADALDGQITSDVIHLVLQNPADFHPDDIQYCCEQIRNLHEFCQEITYPELLLLEERGLITKNNALELLEILRRHGNVECMQELILYLNKNQILGDYMERFHLEL